MQNPNLSYHITALVFVIFFYVLYLKNTSQTSDRQITYRSFPQFMS